MCSEPHDTWHVNFQYHRIHCALQLSGSSQGLPKKMWYLDLYLSGRTYHLIISIVESTFVNFSHPSSHSSWIEAASSKVMLQIRLPYNWINHDVKCQFFPMIPSILLGIRPPEIASLLLSSGQQHHSKEGTPTVRQGGLLRLEAHRRTGWGCWAGILWKITCNTEIHVIWRIHRIPKQQTHPTLRGWLRNRAWTKATSCNHEP